MQVQHLGAAGPFVQVVHILGDDLHVKERLEVDAAAVTDEVSFIAVPANIPNDSPEEVENPNMLPMVGNMRAAIEDRKSVV